MARTSDPNSAGSQFFICLERQPHLDGQYTAFGKTANAESLAVVKAIGAVKTGGDDRPAKPMKINKATVIETRQVRLAHESLLRRSASFGALPARLRQYTQAIASCARCNTQSTLARRRFLQHFRSALAIAPLLMVQVACLPPSKIRRAKCIPSSWP